MPSRVEVGCRREQQISMGNASARRGACLGIRWVFVRIALLLLFTLRKRARVSWLDTKCSITGVQVVYMLDPFPTHIYYRLIPSVLSPYREFGAKRVTIFSGE